MTGEERMTLRFDLYFAGVYTEKWGIGEAKTFDHLVKELESGEAKIDVDYDRRRVTRKTRVLILDIFYQDAEGRRWALKEDKQVFKDYRVRRRNLGSSVSEKMIRSESIDQAMQRALEEELQITTQVFAVFQKSYTTRQESKSYPGLMTESEKFRYSVLFTHEQYRPEGYIEIQDGLTTYFVWEEVAALPDEDIRFPVRFERT